MGERPGGLNPMQLRQAFACFPSGVTAICAMVGSRPLGMAASSFTSVSLDPPLVSVCVAHSSTTWPRLQLAPSVGVSVLADNHDRVCCALSSKRGDRFADVRWEASTDGAVFVSGAALWLACRIEQEITAGDHEIIVLRVFSLRVYPGVAPLVFHDRQFRELSASIRPPC
jgi:flavin reductase (DIM6/NTAB) family NADH-FMN oxidoreductase RutF